MRNPKKRAITSADLEAELQKVETLPPDTDVRVPELDCLVGSCNFDPWSPREEQILRVYYGRVPTAKLAKYLGRTAGQIRNKVTRLGLHFVGKAEFRKQNPTC